MKKPVMNLKEARQINGNVARWYLDTKVFGKEATVPPYPRNQMLEAFQLVNKANKIKAVRDDGKQILYTVCDERLADLVVQARGW